MADLERQYQKALRLFLLTRYAQAAASCLQAIELLPLPQESLNGTKVWALYLTIGTTLLNRPEDPTPNTLSTLGLTQSVSDKPISKKSACYGLWTNLTDWYQNLNLVDPSLVTSAMVMSLKLNVPAVGRQVVEEWYSSLSEATVDHLSVAGEDDGVMKLYRETVDLYVCRVLPALNDYDSARSFLEYNSFLSPSAKTTLEKSITAHQEAAKRQEEQKAAQKEKEKERERRELEKKEQQQQSKKATEATSSRALQDKSPRTLADSSLATSIRTWLLPLTQNSNYGVLFVLFILFGLLRYYRSQLSPAFKGLMAKLWQTVQMGTKVTYM
ncbi:hypothetical protein PHYBLDRAFT_185118 [Phycomyces blakesleeanus NRRL 1555(-)]|uniref:Uncharacterized protein n=1 Tax=Phycomyces blakesleeanus (strain ATCC 8743b / DSM 1359 / FGSC 10004 / NBRC 33097 / NRRL 1555) TaxID=763407 RepID=A0A163EEC2_PHYB8|nr:hypothetical protein PHYBLDRAFT_185118 [Phycomyces blakesleeanus NRRL 1555(-)]OAD78190.1 hypothetical protein PHYBLDRAFT_185118 [Phycomyces blakesleeanus NRRL 1555(-)]|eukprot:XP_018296230.1 hypothetical protein PHYBLDRAFT_185118 [Phycomyces blakesleeanus NRRL 1555(-)]